MGHFLFRKPPSLSICQLSRVYKSGSTAIALTTSLNEWLYGFVQRNNYILCKKVTYYTLFSICQLCIRKRVSVLESHLVWPIVGRICKTSCVYRDRDRPTNKRPQQKLGQHTYLLGGFCYASSSTLYSDQSLGSSFKLA